MNWLVTLSLLLAQPALAETVILYSRVDSSIAHNVQAVSALHTATFIDKQLPAGVLWREAIAERICKADKVILIWSAHSAVSNEVRREIDQAFKCGRQFQLILLDDTPLAGLLADINGIVWE